jgi:cytochrome P450
VDELLRYDAPVQLSRRITLEETEIGGRTIAPNTLVMTHLAAANRDPAKWGPTADQVDVGRPDASQHVTFGSGIHFCLGAALARLEGQVAMSSIIRRFPDLELAGDPVPNGRITLRGLDSLPVTG